MEDSVNLRLAVAVNSAPCGLLMLDAAGSIILANREVERLFGYERDELLGSAVEVLVPQRHRHQHPGLRAGFVGAPSARAMGAGRDLFGRRKDGSEVPVEIGLTPVETPEGLFIISSIVDISARQTADRERRGLEEQLRQAQKIEALGRLAGGVAHDFNNVLATILGIIELAEAEGSLRPADLAELRKAAERGRALIGQILRFGRRGAVERIAVDPAVAVEEVLRMLRATLPRQVEIKAEIEEAVPAIDADPTAVSQVLVNLATNAAHAMPNGGLLCVKVAPSYVRDHVARANPGLREGEYVAIEVADSGCGMDPETLDRAFEPFFSTKAEGQGSGLGLAIVHAVMRDHEGNVRIDSEPGRGTTVTCLFPASVGALRAEVDTRTVAPLPGDGERVLLIDDEPSLVEITRRGLLRLGFQVTALTDPRLAIERLEADPTAYDVVVTDRSMPHVTGLDVAARVRQIAPRLPLILMTGWAGDLDQGALDRWGITATVAKPVPLPDLAQLLREVMDRPPDPPDSPGLHSPAS